MKRSVPVNRLLASLPLKDSERLLAKCDQVELKSPDVLSEPAARIEHVYFPLVAFISTVLPVAGHASVEVGLIGNEGLFGIPLVLGVDRSPLQAFVRSSGAALRIDSAAFVRELALSRPLRRELNRYICVVLSQLAQTAACLRFHVLEARLARWLLMTQDQVHSHVFYLTHEFLAQALGVRRVGVTNAAGRLQQRKLVSYSRGDITILDRAGLEAASCECYRATLNNYESILG